MVPPPGAFAVPGPHFLPPAMAQAYPVPAQNFQPAYLDQRCFDLVKAKKTVKKIGRCQIFSGYALIAVNAINALANLFFMFTLNSWSSLTVEDNQGKRHTVQLDTCGLYIMTLFKILVHLLLVKWGILALKTFKPIVKDLNRQEIAGMF